MGWREGGWVDYSTITLPLPEHYVFTLPLPSREWEGNNALIIPNQPPPLRIKG